LANILIGLSFLLFSIFLWTGYGVISMDAFQIVAHNKTDPAFWTVYPNFLFWLFWLSTALNLYFTVKLQRNKT